MGSRSADVSDCYCSAVCGEKCEYGGFHCGFKAAAKDSACRKKDHCDDYQLPQRRRRLFEAITASGNGDSPCDFPGATCVNRADSCEYECKDGYQMVDGACTCLDGFEFDGVSCVE